LNKAYFILAILCLGLLNKNVAQETISETENRISHFITGVGGSYVNVLDEGISPLLYNGIGGSVILGHLTEKDSKLNTSHLKFDFNNPNSSISNAEMYTFRLEGHYQQYWNVSNENDKFINLNLGFDLSGKWALRQHLSYTNNSQHIETRISVAPAILIDKSFTLWKRKFDIGMFVNIPVVTYATRPLFASTKFPASINKEEVEFFDYILEGDIISFNKYFKWSNQMYLYYPLKNGNGLRLDYFWSFESYQSQNPIKTAEHAIMISTFFQL